MGTEAIGVVEANWARRDAVLAANQLDPYATARIKGVRPAWPVDKAAQEIHVEAPKPAPIPRTVEEPTPFWDTPAGRAKLAMGEQMGLPAEPRIPVGQIIRAVCLAAGVSFEDMLRGGRPRRLAHPRHVAMLLVHELRPELSLPQIAHLIGGMDHTSVIHGVREARKRVEQVGRSQVWYCKARAVLVPERAA